MTNEITFRRGDVVISVFSGDYGKPRPALVVQSDLFNETHSSVVVCPISSELTGLSIFRIHVPASESNGLRGDSEVMIDKMGAIARRRIGRRVGRVSGAQLNLVSQALRIWLELPAE